MFTHHFVYYFTALVLMCMFATLHAQQLPPYYSIETVAGGGNLDTNNSTLATQVLLHDPKELAIHDQTGDVYLLDEYNIRKITKSNGYMQKLFGTSGYGAPFTGPMTSVPLGNLTGIVMDGDNIYFSTFYSTNYYIYKLFENTTMLPSATVHTSNEILKFQLGSDSSIYYLDSKQKKVWKKKGLDTAITTGPLNQPVGLHVSGLVCYISDVGNNMINIVNTSSQTVQSLQPMDQPTSSFIDDLGQLFVSSGQFIKKIQLDGNISVIAGSAIEISTADNWNATQTLLKFPVSVKVWKREIYFIDREDKKVRKLTPRCNSGYTLSQDMTICNMDVPSNVISCFGKLANDTSVCSGNGTCNAQNLCVCYSGYSGVDCSVLNSTASSNSTQPEPVVKSFNIWLSKYSDILDTTQSTQVSIISLLTETLNYEWKCLNCSNNVNYSISNVSPLLVINSGSIPGVYLFQAQAFKGTEQNSTLQYFSLKIIQANYISKQFSIKGMPQALISNKKVENLFVISKLELSQELINIWMKDCQGSESNCQAKYSLSISYKIGLQTFLKRTESSAVTLSQTTGLQMVSLKYPLVIQFSDSTVDQPANLVFSLNLTNMAGSEIISSTEIPIYQSMKPLDSTNLITNITILEGVAIRDQFNITINSWNSSLALQYAIGVRYMGQLVRISEYSYNRTLSVCFPYLKQGEYYISIFAMDNYGNVDVASSSIPIKISPFDGIPVDLVNRVVDSNSNFNTIASIALDMTFDKSKQLIGQFVTKIEPQFSNMFLFNIITQNINLVDQDVMTLLASKFGDLLVVAKTSYLNSKQLFGFVTTKISRQDIESFVGVLSNLISDFDNILKLTNSLSELLILGEIPLNSTLLELPKVEFNTENINLTISSFNIFTSNSVKSLNQGKNKISFETNSILSTYDAFDKDCAVSLTNYAKTNLNDSRNSSSSVLDFKFFKENQILKLSNLLQPILLTFETKTVNTSDYSCDYWDEQFKSWKSDGCLVNQVQENFIECACNHTTMFTTFLGQKRVVTNVDVMKQVSDTYFAQISFGVFYLIISLTVLVTLVIFRKSQPIASRLATPYIGMIALIVECVLIYIIQRSVLVDQLVRKTSSSSQESQNADTAATLIANIVMIFVNSLNLSAILSYLIQVIRFELLKYFYNLISITKDKSKNNTLKFLKIMTSNKIFLSVLTVFCFMNLCYWTLWVILVGVKVISLETFAYITSISYAVLILTMGSLISCVLFIDFIVGCVNTKNRTVKEVIFTQDEPLYFKWEMVLFVICFLFLILNISLGLSTLESRYKSEEAFMRIIPNDNASFAFELFYILFYILVFGGFSSIMTILHKIKLQNRRGAIKLENDEDDNKELFILLGNSHGCARFEQFCKKEFSTENLYLYQYVKQQNGNVNREILDYIYENHVKAGSVMEVNIPSNCSKSFTKMVNQQEVDTSSAMECIETLMENVLLNLSDTFSRFVFTEEYISFSKDSEMRDVAMSRFNLVDSK